MGVKPLLDVIIYSDLFVAKPSPLPFRAAVSQLGMEPSDALYVGDNPAVDFEGAKAIGMRTVRVSRGEFRHDQGNDYIDWTIHGFDELLDITARLREADNT